MGFIGGHLPEIIIVLVVILIIWGPGKLPDVGAGIGKGIREFRKASSETHDAVMGTTTSDSGAAGTGRSGRRRTGARSGARAAGRAGGRPGRRDDTPALSFWLTRRSGAR